LRGRVKVTKEEVGNISGEGKVKYQTIVIDPPWEVHNNLKDLKYYRTGKTMPYKLMSDEQIKRFPINDFAGDRCDLFLWTITSRIPFATTELLDAWGFRYVDFFAWDKEIGVPVNGVYRQVEWLIYAYRGKMGINKKGKFIRSMFREKRGRHSRKPDCVYEVLSNNTREPRIDIFAREPRGGFDVWGDEIHQTKDDSDSKNEEAQEKADFEREGEV